MIRKVSNKEISQQRPEYRDLQKVGTGMEERGKERGENSKKVLCLELNERSGNKTILGPLDHGWPSDSLE